MRRTPKVLKVEERILHIYIIYIIYYTGTLHNYNVSGVRFGDRETVTDSCNCF